MNFALIGNPNSGKTTLFNHLTGSHAHVGNWPGVTVEKKEGKYLKSKNINIIDLPGIYSLSPYSSEEIVSRNYILNEKPDLVINIVDASNIERNLYLTSQLLETEAPVIVALNMMDAAEAAGLKINIKKLEIMLGVDIIPISANKNEGIDELMKAAVKRSKEKRIFKFLLSETPVGAQAKLIRNAAKSDGANITLFSALRLLEADENEAKRAGLSQSAISEINKIIQKAPENEWDIKIAQLRYELIENISKQCIEKIQNEDKPNIDYKIDNILTNRFLAIPIFLGIMFLIFNITFGKIGNIFKAFADKIVDFLCSGSKDIIISLGAGDWAVSLLSDGIISCLGAVLVFLPQIIILFFFLSILEESGYMARVAFIMDRPLRKFALSGKSFVPMLMGFGCSVPAIMASRTIENEKDRIMTIILTPFMSCGARLPVYAVFASAFFSAKSGYVIMSLYLFGIAAALLSALILKSSVLKPGESSFILELPPYRLPSAKTVFIRVWEKAKEFLKKVFTTLLIVSVIIWFLQNFNLQLRACSAEESIFALLGKIIYPIFQPLGIKNWRACAALLSGFAAKEAVLSSLSALYASSGNLSLALKADFTPLSAYSYLVFILLYMPCVAACAAMKKELKSFKLTAFALCYQCAIAWIASFLVYRIGCLFM